MEREWKEKKKARKKTKHSQLLRFGSIIYLPGILFFLKTIEKINFKKDDVLK